jgi:putative membrane protein
MHVVLRYLGTVTAVVLTVYLVPGVQMTGGWSAIFLAALVWSVLVTVIKPILQVITLPITVLTFGLFALVLNAILFYVVDVLVPGFEVVNFLGALLGAFVLSVLSWLIHQLL